MARRCLDGITVAMMVLGPSQCLNSDRLPYHSATKQATSKVNPPSSSKYCCNDLIHLGSNWASRVRIPAAPSATTIVSSRNLTKKELRRRKTFILHIPDSTIFLTSLSCHHACAFLLFLLSFMFHLNLNELWPFERIIVHFEQIIANLCAFTWLSQHALVSPWTKSQAHTRMRITLQWFDYTVNLLSTT